MEHSPPSSLKSLFLGCLIAIAFLLLLEFILLLIGIPSFGDKVHILSESVHFNLNNNPFNHYDRDMIFKVRPNPIGKPINDHEGINAQGFRGHLINSNFKGKKIYFFGDSCVFGWGLPSLKQTIPFQLELELKKEINSLQVYNMGIPGHSTTQGNILLKKIHPSPDDIIIIYYGWNDIWPAPVLTDEQTLDFFQVYDIPVVSFLLQTRIYAAFFYLARKFNIAKVHTEKIRVPLNQARSNLMRMSAWTEQPIIIILPPFSREKVGAKKTLQMLKYHQMIKSIPNKKVLFLNLQDKMSEKYFFEDGFHPNAKGTQFISQALTSKIKNYLEQGYENE